MSQGADAADQVVQEGIQVTESAAKLAGLGVKNLAIILLQLLADNKKLKGRTALNELLQADTPPIAYSIDRAALPQFSMAAGENDIQFSPLPDNGLGSKMNIIVHTEDAFMAQRIFDSIKQPASPMPSAKEGKSNQNWLKQMTERITDPAKRYESKTGPLESLGAETLAALVYQLAEENREHMEASPLSRVFEEGKGLQLVEVPDHCKPELMKQVKVLDVPLHLQASASEGKLTMMARSEDAAIINRLFENMGLEKPMLEDKAPHRNAPAANKAEPAPATSQEKGAKDIDAGRIAVKVAFSKASEQAKSGKSPMVAAHKSAKAKAASR